ncbi:2-methylcitrate dehydratase PrpD [Aspergillus heteromorphus CBS 117.55]|uniref:2-methylcitrate dehydratase PrpD n=1 Tax=Aspergillus heteromorphus CBS 117.55 TaxID=1448321 RepID=A0A317W9Q5_9EURO|nr:2-methylcitrate dehydratase PrpD [Aspergillus heteromorphus CBS 117.55]PWY82047.1 2-methylcitrate dehydratase PrpD [Aspergillus heteromorphus CBS 117.55]
MADTPPPVTQELCDWIHRLCLSDIPEEKVTRCKYLILDGLACALIGAHLPWSEDAVKGVLSIEPEGSCNIIGWERKIGPLAAALLNSTFIQGFELDDYHREAPIHSNSIVLPTLLATIEHCNPQSATDTTPLTGAEFLLAAIVGFETGPRVGLGVYGIEVLSHGWHSGAIFGPSAAAASATKLMQLSAPMIEDAVGIACTQAGGLMSAQYESTVKRMQHGFAARNGLFAAFMARSGYTGIKKVLERPYGGFLSTFSQGNGRTPPYQPERVVEGIDSTWEIDQILVKPYASMAATHGTIDAISALQAKYPGELKGNRIRRINVELSEPAFKKGGWEPKYPLTVTGAQMSCAYAAAMQILEGAVQPAQFAPAQLERQDVWTLMGKIKCVHNPDFDHTMAAIWQQRVHVELWEGDEQSGESKTLVQYIDAPRGNKVPLSNEEILGKWRSNTKDVIDQERREAIEKLVLGLEGVDDVRGLVELLRRRTGNVFDAASGHGHGYKSVGSKI